MSMLAVDGIAERGLWGQGQGSDGEDEGGTTHRPRAAGVGCQDWATWTRRAARATQDHDPGRPGRHGGADKLYIGVANDRGSRDPARSQQGDVRRSVAFAKWCNDQGGIGGLPIEPVDIDGKLLEVEAAMTTACTEIFAMVGGGCAQDDLVFTGKDGSDFHKCR